MLSRLLGRSLVRLQCYEGLDVNSAVYEWDYSRQMLHIRLLEATGAVDRQQVEQDLFGAEFLLKRPLLQAVDPADGRPPLLLIDELDRADEEFEAFLLELLSDFQITVPEIGTMKAEKAPTVIITSNRTREIHDALRRRCLYHWIEYPSAAKEYEIVRAKVPQASENLCRQISGFVERLRQIELYKSPGVAETLDWAIALVKLEQMALTRETVESTLGVLLKYQDDLEQVRGEVVEKALAQIAV